MRTVSCSSCDAVFPASAIPAPNATRCPRCDEPLTGPRKSRFPFVAAKLTPVDLVHPAHCSSCGCILSLTERAAGTSTICRYPLCQHKRAVAAALEFQQKTIDEAARTQAEELTRVEEKLEELGLDPAKYEVAVLPANTRPLEKMSEQRKNALADRLAEIAAEIRLGPSEETTASYELGSRPTDMSFIGQACATCRGDCCQNGGDRAYLTRQTLKRVMDASPGISLEEVIRAYLDHVPEESYAGSCIYHTEKGCTLPGEKRSDTCNDFFCTGTRSLASVIAAAETSSLEVVAAALSGQKIVRLAVINGREMKFLFGE